ncbi:MAG: endonuclease III [Candidatus Omnitrophota bacterium]|nr:endonuclease III [Candidatus Omnitrophota bacterium]
MVNRKKTVVSPAVTRIFGLIEKQARSFARPWVSSQYGVGNPFRVLISCIISLRTKEVVTAAASARLFRVAANARLLAKIPEARIARLIYPAGFYRTKAKTIRAVSGRLVREFCGTVPYSLNELLSFPGVGRKTANLVRGVGFAIPAICVDVHVHRVSNRLGWVKTRKPFETEEALMRIFDRRYWIGLNDVLVTFGQNICVPVSPFCSRCMVSRYCKRVGVTRSR